MGFSILLHALLLALLAGSLARGRIEGGAGAADGEVHAITVSLAGLRGAPRTARTRENQALDALFERIRAEQSALTATDKPKPAPGDLAKLFDVIEPETTAPAGADKGGRGQGAVDQGGLGASPAATAAKLANNAAGARGSSPAVGPGSDTSAGGLWGQIEPCWSRLPAASAVPVTLELSLNDKGQIAVPPKIIRPTRTAPDQMRLIAEARALAALAACTPYHLADGARWSRTVQVSFGASSTSGRPPP